jgi:hypothetical protein
MKPPSRIVSARGAGGRPPRKKSKDEARDKFAEDKRLIAYFEETKRQIEVQLRAAGRRRAAEEAGEIAAKDYGYTLENMRRKITRIRARARKD